MTLPDSSQRGLREKETTDTFAHETLRRVFKHPPKSELQKRKVLIK
jgi:hypothetical protein